MSPKMPTPARLLDLEHWPHKALASEVGAMAEWIVDARYTLAEVDHELRVGDASDAFGLVGDEVRASLEGCRDRLARMLDGAHDAEPVPLRENPLAMVRAVLQIAKDTPGTDPDPCYRYAVAIRVALALCGGEVDMSREAAIEAVHALIAKPEATK